MVVVISGILQGRGADFPSELMEMDLSGKPLPDVGAEGLMPVADQRDSRIAVGIRHSPDKFGEGGHKTLEEQMEEIVMKDHIVVAPIGMEHIADDEQNGAIGAGSDEPVGDTIAMSVLIHEDVGIEERRVVASGAEHGGVDPGAAVMNEQFEANKIGEHGCGHQTALVLAYKIIGNAHVIAPIGLIDEAELAVLDMAELRMVARADDVGHLLPSLEPAEPYYLGPLSGRGQRSVAPDTFADDGFILPKQDRRDQPVGGIIDALKRLALDDADNDLTENLAGQAHTAVLQQEPHPAVFAHLLYTIQESHAERKN